MTTLTWTDVAPRDGLQNISATVPTAAKLRLIRGLFATGVPRVEATAFVSSTWVPQLADAADVLNALTSDERGRIRVLIPNRRGLDLALEHRVGNVLVTIGATDSFNLRNVNRSVDASFRDLSDIVETARAAGCQVDVALSVAFGCPYEGAVSVERVADLSRALVEAGADEVGIADTIGVATPSDVRRMHDAVSDIIAPDRLAFHFHDTRGAGVANVVTAYELGVRRFDGSAGGLGGCPFAPRSTGNVCSEDALSALIALGARAGVDLTAYCRVSQQLAADLGHELPGKLYRAGVWEGRPFASDVGTEPGAAAHG